MTAFVAVAAAAVAWTACAGCGDKPAGGGGGGGTDKPADGGGKPAGGTYDKAKGTATVKVKVTYGGAAVTPVMYKMGTPDSCSGHNDKMVKETSEVNANGTLPHAFVWAHDGPHKDLSGYDKGGSRTLDQKSCVYTPHVLGALVGQDIVLKNSDPTGHNVHIKPSKNDNEVNKSQAAGKSDTVQFKKAEEAIPVNCDVHSWMNAWIFVVKHPFFDTSARETGVATISGLYPGKYTFKVWHDTWGKTAKTVEVEVKDGETKEVTVELK